MVGFFAKSPRFLFAVGWLLVVVGVSVAIRGDASAAATIYVDDMNCPVPGTGALLDPYCTIQSGVNAAGPGDTVSVKPGNYTGTIDVVSKTGLTIVGDDPATVIVKPTSTLCWGLSYGCGRWAVLRVITSTNVNVSNMTFDLDLVKANSVFGGLIWDSTGSLTNNRFKNSTVADASGGYTEGGVYVRAPGYSDGSRANVFITGNTFTDFGRVAVLTHDFVQATIQGNTFTRILNDFGYGIEMGSRSTGTISGNTISGYDTAALSDGSTSAGIYVENAFTGSCFGGVPHMNKAVTISGNNIHTNQFGMWIGNGYDCYAGDVDIQVNLSNNNVHDNLEGGVFVEDEDRADGSSVTITGDSNTVANNGPAGFYFNTYGDGELHATINNGSITGNTAGILVEDNATGPSTSVYDLRANFNDITGNTTGVSNTVGAGFDAKCNWWGANSGPGPVGPGSGDPVSANVVYAPWLPASGASCGPGQPLAVGGIAGLLDAGSARVPAASGNSASSGQPLNAATLGGGAAALIALTIVAGWYARRRLLS